MKKSLRNKALRSVDRLITGTYKDQLWYVPGGWYATIYPVYDGYKPLKSQIVSDAKPDMTAIIEKISDMVTATEFNRLTEDGIEFVTLNTIDRFKPLKVNAIYYDLLKDLHPDAEIKISSMSMFDPIGFYENDQLVALLMPLKS